MLWVTEQTVKFHLSNTYRKLGVSNRTEASRWAQVNGLLDTRRAPTLGRHSLRRLGRNAPTKRQVRCRQAE